MAHDLLDEEVNREVGLTVACLRRQGVSPRIALDALGVADQSPLPLWSDVEREISDRYREMNWLAA